MADKKKEHRKRTKSLLNDAVQKKRSIMRETLENLKEEVENYKLNKKVIQAE